MSRFTLRAELSKLSLSPLDALAFPRRGALSDTPVSAPPCRRGREAPTEGGELPSVPALPLCTYRSSAGAAALSGFSLIRGSELAVRHSEPPGGGLHWTRHHSLRPTESCRGASGAGGFRAILLLSIGRGNSRRGKA